MKVLLGLFLLTQVHLQTRPTRPWQPLESSCIGLSPVEMLLCEYDLHALVSAAL